MLASVLLGNLGLAQNSDAVGAPAEMPKVDIISCELYSDKTQTYVDRTDSVLSSHVLTFGPEETAVAFAFKLAPSSSHVSYYLEGMQQDWIALPGSTLHLHSPPPGQYRLHLRQADATHTLISSSLTLGIEAQPAVIQAYMAWFWVGGGITILLSWGLFLLWRVRKYHRDTQGQLRQKDQIIEDLSTKVSASQTSKSNMFADIVHEIRSPLSLIMGLNEAIMIDRYGSANRNIKGATRIALRNGQKLVKLVEEILELSKLEMIDVELEEKPVNLYSYSHGLYDMLRPRALAKGIDLQFQYDLDRQMCVMLDLNKFEKIFNNLLDNAIKFTPQDGTICINFQERLENEYIELRVSDTGPGIPEEELTLIFDRHRQTEKKKLSGSYGVGIGLALAKSYAELFGGDILVKSRLNHGTTFTFIMPKRVATAPVSPTVVPQKVVPTSPLSKGDFAEPVLPKEVLTPSQCPSQVRRLLVVEDSVDMQNFLHQLLSTHYQVTIASDGQHALDILASVSEPFDLIVSDMIMPRMDGLELLQHIRATDGWRSLPFLMLTAETRDTQRKSAFTFGVDDYLIKPFASDELMIRIKAILDNATSRMAWHQKQKKRFSTAATTEEKANTPTVQMTQADLDWLKKLEEITQKEISNRQFNLFDLASAMAVSERQLFRRIKRLTGMTPNKYLRDIKLFAAKELLENYTYGTISEVSYAVGFEDPHYFSKLYATRFGKKPSAYFSKKSAP